MPVIIMCVVFVVIVVKTISALCCMCMLTASYRYQRRFCVLDIDRMYDVFSDGLMLD